MFLMASWSMAPRLHTYRPVNGSRRLNAPNSYAHDADSVPVPGACQSNPRSVTKLIDRIRHDIQQRLDQLLAEAEKLRHALAALDPRERSGSKPTTTSSQPAVKQAAKASDAPKQTPTRTRTRTARTTNG